ncbi:MAG: hypothetical protein ACK5T5_12905 [Phenylobacterium sp.]|jgi:hypothetical protein
MIADFIAPRDLRALEHEICSALERAAGRWRLDVECLAAGRAMPAAGEAVARLAASQGATTLWPVAPVAQYLAQVATQSPSGRHEGLRVGSTRGDLPDRGLVVCALADENDEPYETMERLRSYGAAPLGAVVLLEFPSSQACLRLRHHGVPIGTFVRLSPRRADRLRRLPLPRDQVEKLILEHLLGAIEAQKVRGARRDVGTAPIPASERFGLALLLEAELCLEIQEEDLEGMTTVADACRLVRARTRQSEVGLASVGAGGRGVAAP